MTILGALLYWALQLFWYAMLASFLFQLLLSVNPGYRPRGFWLYFAEISLSITDVPLRLLRRVLKPIRIGPVMFDLAWTALFLLVLLCQRLVLTYL
jgi:YggT family protein